MNSVCSANLLACLPACLLYVVLFFYYMRLERLWSTMDSGCSPNLRLLACSMYLPKYDPVTKQTVGPCKSTCKDAKRRCKAYMGRWPRKFRCKKLPTDETTCITPLSVSLYKKDHAYCTPNPGPMCGTLPYILGTLPNIFFQNSATEIGVELRHYQRLVDSGCSRKASFFLCGTLMPFCIHHQVKPYAMPCREVCEEVYNNCSATYQSLYKGLSWPTKLECHNFPSAAGYSSGNCIMS